MNKHLTTMRVFNKDLSLKCIKNIFSQKIFIFGVDEHTGIQASSKFRDVLKRLSNDDLRHDDKFILSLPFKKILNINNKSYMCYGKMEVGVSITDNIPPNIKRDGLEEFASTMDYLFDIKAWPYGDIASKAGIYLKEKK